MQIIFPSHLSPHVLTSYTSSQATGEYSGARVSQYNSSEQASVRSGVGEVSPATSRDQLKTTRWRFYNGQDWDTGHWWWPTPGWLWHRPHPLATYWLGPLLSLVFDFEYKTSTNIMFLNMQDLFGKTWAFSVSMAGVVVKEGVILRLPHPSTCFLSDESKYVVTNIMKLDIFSYLNNEFQPTKRYRVKKYT